MNFSNNINLSSKHRIRIAVTYDTSMGIIAFLGALYLKFDHITPAQDLLEMILLSAVGNWISLSLSGLYKGLWRFASTNDLLRIFRASFFGILINILLINLNASLHHFPLSLFLINWLLYVVLLGGGRFAYRLFKDNYKLKKEFNTLIVGSGQAAETLYREIRKTLSLPYNVIGFVDNDIRVIGRTLHGISIFGDLSKLSSLIKEHNIKVVLISETTFSQTTIKEIFSTCSHLKVELKMLPTFAHALSGKLELNLLRKVRPEDLLMREAISINLDSVIPMIKDQAVLITGVGGSIGSELALQVASFNPRKMILFEISEYFLYEIEGKLKEFFPHIDIIPILGDVRDTIQLENVFSSQHPYLVFHAAAYKHVPMVEKNFISAIRTNVKGTLNIAKTANKFNVHKVVLISTDKAVNPTNIMGATKRIAEIIFQLEQQLSSTTKFVTVRFGNVLGSNGSVIPKFKEQIEKGGPITVTHPEINRFFMSIPEASQLVIQAAGMGNGSEIFILEMGTPIKIVDLAEQMIKLAGLIPYQDIDIQYTGLRPGEKMYEELCTGNEKTINTEHVKVKMVIPEIYSKDLLHLILKIISLVPETSLTEVREYIKAIVPEYDFLNQDQPSHQIPNNVLN